MKMEQKAWHSMDIEEVLSSLETSLNGLTEEEAGLRLRRFGLNEIEAEKRPHPLRILLSQFKSVLIIILLFATVFSAIIGETIDAIVILIIIAASAGLGFIQEYRAERALESLKKMLSPTITVLRNGEADEIPSSRLVPGDVVLLEAGDRIPADARLFEIANLKVDESSLTGESVPVTKVLDLFSPDTYLADRGNMVFSGTTVTYGRGKAIVTATGMATEFGKIAKEVTVAVQEKTPLERRTEEIGKWLGTISLGVCFTVAVLSIIREYLLEGFLESAFLLEIVMFAVALAVAAVPEALPAIVTGTLAIGMREMARRNALVRKMAAVETLGSTTVICTDKTGTLTKGEMTVRRIYVDGQTIEVTGVGYEPKGELRFEKSYTKSDGTALSLLAKASILCSDAKLEEKDGEWYIRGDPTEGAMIVFAEKAGFHQEDTRCEYPRIGELPFSSERKRMSTVHAQPEGRKKMVFMKGAPEVVLERCAYINEEGSTGKLTEGWRQEILSVSEKMAADALRVLSLAYKEISEATIDFHEEDLEEDLTFLGLIGMMDPPREEAIHAVRVSKEVGIRSIMMTGDHKLTAVAIAKEMEIFQEGDLALTGSELEGMSDEEFEQIVEKVTVYARVSPIHKLKIVKAWKRKGEVVAMTGDGVNDAPAVKNADIGIAMGVTGTDVTKEASDMVLADDNFATIVKAIEKGRWIFDNIKKYLTYLLQCNLIEIIVIGGGVLLGLPLPLIPVQILYINLATDGLPALALGVSPPDPDVMRRPPHDPKESIFTRDVKAFLITIPLVISPILFWIFLTSLLEEGLNVARTDLFLVFIFFELTVALNCRSLSYTVFKVRPHRFLLLAILWEVLLLSVLISIPFVREAFGILLPSLRDVATAIGICLAAMVALELLKVSLARQNPLSVKP
ncbi:cation-translocating P-type ATPase [Candidatus Bathyarchaeota archaeon]|nr:cation-translocating P-type ATPase [Candidatus Bathyarchaeota archaeon]